MKKKPPSKRLKAHRWGMSAETLCVRWLKLKGYDILAERYRNAFGEIDIVAIKADTLVIIEVKARKTFRDCIESMPPAKQQRLIRAASALKAYPGKFAGRIGANVPNIRFDLMMVVPWRLPKHLKDAWRA